MKKLAMAGLMVGLMAAVGVLKAQDDAPPIPMTPVQPEHKLLEQFVGQWEGESEVTMTPGQPPMKVKGSESARMIGGFWMVAEHQTTFGEMKFTAIMTLGYDPKTKKYIGTWIDSVMNHMWKYEGTVDETGKIFTLLAEGPNPAAPNGVSTYRDVFEFKTPDHKVLTSSVQTPDGGWQAFSVGNYHRKKE